MTDANPLHTVNLNRFALLCIDGADAERFLQGQLTCDVVKLADMHWELGACCTAKGRMVANFVIARIGSAYWLRLPQAQAEALKQHLSRYAVFYKTSMTLVSDHELWGTLPAQPVQITAAGQHTVSRSDELITLSWPDGRNEYWGTAAPDSRSDEGWQALDIAMGLVWVNADSHEAWVPQYIDWQDQGGINFRKGCYTGQEIVARLQYLGKTKKHLASATSAEPLSLSVGEQLSDSEGKHIAEVASWQGQNVLVIVSGETPTNAYYGEKSVTLGELFYTEDQDSSSTPE
jgi:folate-binding protein YgfZ